MRPKEPPRLAATRSIGPSFPFRLISQRLARRYDLHWHEFYELTYVREGRGCNIVNGLPCELVPGSFYLLTPADFHEIEPEPGGWLDIYNFIFSEDMWSGELRDLMFREERRLSATAPADMRSELEAEFRLILLEADCQGAGSRLLVRGAMERILISLLRLSASESRLSERRAAAYRHDGVQRALTYLRHHFREPITLEGAAKIANLSPGYFSECFHRLTGVPFQKHLQDLRLDFAKSLIAASDITVTEACLVSGFHTLTHFERAFKRKFGLSPRVVRKSWNSGAADSEADSGELLKRATQPE